MRQGEKDENGVSERGFAGCERTWSMGWSRNLPNSPTASLRHSEPKRIDRQNFPSVGSGLNPEWVDGGKEGVHGSRGGRNDPIPVDIQLPEVLGFLRRHLLHSVHR